MQRKQTTMRGSVFCVLLPVIVPSRGPKKKITLTFERYKEKATSKLVGTTEMRSGLGLHLCLAVEHWRERTAEAPLKE